MKSILVNSLNEAIIDHAADKKLFVDGKATDKLENCVVSIFVKGGPAQILLPPEEGLAEKLNNRFSFGEKILIEDFFEILDIKISVYNNELSIKYFATLKEGLS